MTSASPSSSREIHTKQIICLANSRKLKGRCIAGIDISNAQEATWIRPVTESLTGEIPQVECAYSLGHSISVLDVLKVRLAGPRAKGYQQENWLIDRVQPWAYIGRAQLVDIEKGLSIHPTIWTNGSSSSGGVNDRIHVAAMGDINDSLRLVKVDQLELVVKAPYGGKGAPQLRARFTYKQDLYNLKITDPRYETSYQTKPIGAYALGPAYVTISLGEPFEGHVYKLVAAIIDPKLL
jgi:hypothetical protein